MNLLFLGMPGSGKDTQADLLAERFNFENISTGQLLRNELAAGTEDGKEAEQYLASGRWAPDSLVYKVLEGHLKTVKTKNLILNGAIRRASQIHLLDSVLELYHRPLQKVVYFSLAEEVALERMLSRKRADDKESIIRTRFSEFKITNDPILSAYKKRGLLIDIDASSSIESIHQSVVAALELSD